MKTEYRPRIVIRDTLHVTDKTINRIIAYITRKAEQRFGKNQKGFSHINEIQMNFCDFERPIGVREYSFMTVILSSEIEKINFTQDLNKFHKVIIKTDNTEQYHFFRLQFLTQKDVFVCPICHKKYRDPFYEPFCSKQCREHYKDRAHREYDLAIEEQPY